MLTGFEIALWHISRSQVILGDFQVTFGIQQFWHGRKNSVLRLVPQLHSELMSLDLSVGHHP